MRSDLNDRAKVVYAALSMFAGTDGECWPGEERLAEVTHRSLRRLREAIKELKDAGIIEVVPGRRINATIRLLDRTKSAGLKTDKSNVDNSVKTGRKAPVKSELRPDEKRIKTGRLTYDSSNIVLKEQEKNSTTPPTPSYPDRVDVDNSTPPNGEHTHLQISFDQKPDTCMLNRLRHYRWNYDAGTWTTPITPANREILAEVLDSYQGHVDFKEVTL